MASAAKSACRTAARQLRASQYTPTNTLTRPFSTTRRTLADTDKKDASASSPTPGYFNTLFYNRLSRDDQAAYTGLSPSDREKMEKVDAALRDEFANDSRTHRELEDQISAELEHLELQFPPAPVERPRREQGFFSMGEKEDIGPDEDDFQGDDISSLGHAELEQTREIREYARLAGWEMPLLASMLNPSSSDLATLILTSPQISQNLLHHPQQPHPFVSAIQPTWANNIPPNEKSLSNSTLKTFLSIPPTLKTLSN
jgi:small subunit ribosomal protein S35